MCASYTMIIYIYIYILDMYPRSVGSCFENIHACMN